MNKLSITDLELNGKKVLVRVDFNVPMKNGVITDDNRIVQALPTIKYVVENGGKAILFSHLGRVKTEEDKAKNSLAPVAVKLEELIGKKVVFITETRGEKLENAINAMNDGDILMFENTRYEDIDGKKESGNDPELGKYWASLGDVFINDAFGTAHRAHASNSGISANIAKTAAGFLMMKEVEFIGGAVDNPVRPFVAILGGAKVSDKISVIENLLKKADKILICGAMSYTFFKSQGLEVGGSKCENDYVEYAKGLLEKANGKIVLPIDVTICKPDPELMAEDFFKALAAAPLKTCAYNEIPSDWQACDCGPKTLEFYAKELEGAKTVVWNGPAGVFEVENYAKGTKGICEILANLKGATTIIGGGDSAAAAISMGYQDRFSHISTGGGASLEYLEGKALPGVEAINNK